ncbi:ankyrin repeat domain protein-like [Thraustotheca clavata]|uniref:Ankyrin repeat domain protein-like n=1 Tax=Thraustotheca clavata TaxID=74557 RepID=A0A1W0A5C4_9STRA|nr:ankyrin repeat domain protein-like [Thraustotheca clavata]
MFYSNNGSDPNSDMNVNGVTSLFVTAQDDHKAIVSVLISTGGNVNLGNNDGATPLHISAFMGHKGIVSMLIVAGANVNQATIDGETPLFNAAYSGNRNIISVLISAGAIVDQAEAVDEKVNNTTFYSALNGHKNTVSNGATPLHVAAYFGHAAIVTSLISAKADLNFF